MTKEEDCTRDKIDVIVEKYRGNKKAIIGLLQDIQEVFRYLPEDVLQRVSAELDLPLGRIYALATFYSSFRLDPVGEHHVCICMGTACHVNGAPRLVETLERELDVKAGGTSPDNKFTLETVNCLGACALGPLITVDGEYHGKLDQDKLTKVINTYKAGKPAEQPEQ